MPTPPLSESVKRATLEAWEACGRNTTAAADHLGIPRNTMQSRLRAARLDKWADHLEPLIPDGQKLKGISTLYNKAGQEVLQWVKTNSDLDRQLAIIKEAADALKADIPKERPIPWSGESNADLCSVYVLTDYHLGQLSCEIETGTAWNTEKSVAFLVDWFATAIQAAPNSERAVLCQLGDFLHFDNMDGVTPTGRNIMDTDARYSFLVKVSILALRKIIEMLLKKHKHVHIIMAEGNHDMASSIWLRCLFADKYADEKRIFVDDSALPYYMIEHGQTSLFFHHGHRKKLAEISKAFAGMYREVFGRTKYSYAHMGHYHHVQSKEDSLMIVEQHPSLAPKDAYSSRGAYMANRGASVITYSKTFGEVSRITIRPEMVTR